MVDTQVRLFDASGTKVNWQQGRLEDGQFTG